MIADLLVHRIARLYTLDPEHADAVDDPAGPGLGAVIDASVAFSGGRVVYVGPAGHAPGAHTVIDGRGMIGLPGLVDPHTHACWAGSRAAEFAQRLAGASYSSILEAGGGILSTVRATRSATEADLAATCRARLCGLRSHGVTTVEVKSGYGLQPEAEARLLRAARACDDTVRVITTFLGAHAIPAEYRDDRAGYVAEVIGRQLAMCAPLADAIDVYCDRGAFSLDEAVTILYAGKAAGLAIKAHAEQVVHTGIAAAAAALGAISVEHLERIDDAGIAALAEHGTVAVLLPGAQLYLRDTSPPVAALREAGVPIALGSDLNPGSSPVHDPWTVATLGCVLQGLTISESVRGMTRVAGRALGRSDLGWLGPTSVGDLALFRPPVGEPTTVDALVQHLGAHRAAVVVRDGVRVV